VLRRTATAVLWYRKAAERGYPPAENNLAALYWVGLGVSRNQAEAVRWYRLAAEQGDTSGRANLARAYASGEGVPADFRSAYFWGLLAQPGQLEIAGRPIQEFVGGLREQISDEEAAQVEARAEEWRRSHPMGEQGWYLVNLSGGPCFITVSNVAIAK
jgi:TPR repeat protein